MSESLVTRFARGEGPVVRVSSNDLTPLQIALAQAGCYGRRWICEDSLGWVEFDTQAEADLAMGFAVWDDRLEVTEAQADAVFRLAEANPVDAETHQRIARKVLDRLYARPEGLYTPQASPKTDLSL